VEVLAVPCGQFFNQEPSGNPDDIANVIRYVRPGNNFVPEFPMFVRSEVNGAGRIPLYKWMTSRCPAPLTEFSDTKILMYAPLSKEDIRWNWEKTLFDKNGQPYRRYASNVLPAEIAEDINTLLSA